MAAQAELLVDLRAKAMHQHDFHAHRLDHRDVLRDRGQLTRRNAFAGQSDHEDLVTEFVDVRRDRAEPGHESEIEDGGHEGQEGQIKGFSSASLPKR